MSIVKSDLITLVPQAGLEEPETHRQAYGIKLFTNGFSGACAFEHQSGSWSNFVDPNGRSNMANPDVTKPVPTTEWEGWRKGVDDVRYLTALKNRNLLWDDWLKGPCLDDINA